MAGTRFELRLSADEARAAWHAGGIDRGEFFLAPNQGEAPRPLARIASGGELSRVMLAFKTLAAGDQPHRTLVFDEVDAGIGGRTATVVGEKLRRLGGATQVLCITHLPPIAAQAATHFAIAKSQRGSRTVTSVTRLDEAGREREIARMMGGEGAATPQLLAGARELLATAKAKVGPDGESERRKSQRGRRRKCDRHPRMARKYLIETYGCQMNVHDSERMAGLLEAAGFEPTDADEDADLVVINTCSVREKAEEKLYTRLGAFEGTPAAGRPRPDGGGDRLRGAAGGRTDPGPIAAGRRGARHPAGADAADAGRAGRHRRRPASSTSAHPTTSPRFPSA